MDVNGVALHVEDRGSGTPVVFLHGWPDSSELWRSQIPVLTNAGYRAIAPDLRGFGRSDKPIHVDAYRLDEGMSDVLGVMDQLGVDRAHVVGHGWGAGLTWALGIHHPDRVDRLVVLGIAHPAAPPAEGIRHYERIWFHWFFQFEGVAEEWLRFDDWKLFREFVSDSSDVDRYVADLSQPGSLTASLNWFRANMRPNPPEPPPDLRMVKASVLAIWASGDLAKGLPEERMLASEQFVEGEWRYERVDASHWLPLDTPDRLTPSLLAWLG